LKACPVERSGKNDIELSAVAIDCADAAADRGQGLASADGLDVLVPDGRPVEEDIWLHCKGIDRLGMMLPKRSSACIPAPLSPRSVPGS
jgi:hypothetical protein